MKSLAAWLACCALALPVTAEDFRHVNWGMSQAAVMATEPGRPVEVRQSGGETVVKYEPVTAELSGRVIYIFANDRLVAPNTDAAYAELEPALKAFLDRLYAGARYTLARESDPKERLSVRAQAEGDVALETLLARLG